MRSLRYYKRCGREERQLREQIVLTPMRNVPVIHANVVRKFQLKVALEQPGENSSPHAHNANGVLKFQPRVALWQPWVMRPLDSETPTALAKTPHVDCQLFQS